MRLGAFIRSRPVEIVLRLVLGGFYVLAAVGKVVDPGQFAEAVANYRLVPHDLINLVAILLPWIELVAGLFVIFGVWLVASTWLINLMTIIFIAAIGSAVWRGLSIECGCFGTVGGRSVGMTAIAEDALLLLCGLLLVWSQRGKQHPAPIREMSVPVQNEG